MFSVVEVFYQPGKLFESLPERPSAWVFPLLVDIAILVASVAALINLVGIESMVRQRLQTTTMSPEQMQVAMQRMNSPAAVYFTYGSAAIGGIVTVFAVAGLLMIFAMMAERKPKFGSMLSMVSLAFLPYWLIAGVMTTLVLIASPDRTSLDFTNLLATNVATFVDKTTTAKGLYSILTSIDLLSFLPIGMLAYGFSKVIRASFGTGLGAVLTLWILLVISRAGAASLF
jgi:hypothetical protein